MKTLLTSLILALSSALHSVADIGDGVLPDPRPWKVRKVYSSGESVEPSKVPYVIVAWANPPKDSKLRGYQIWGSDRILSQEALEKAIKLLIQKSAADIYVVGNDWGAGSELNKTVQSITKTHKIDAYFGSPYLFTELGFRPESEERRKIIAAVIEELTKADGGGQPATRPESK